MPPTAIMPRSASRWAASPITRSSAILISRGACRRPQGHVRAARTDAARPVLWSTTSSSTTVSRPSSPAPRRRRNEEEPGRHQLHFGSNWTARARGSVRFGCSSRRPAHGLSAASSFPRETHHDILALDARRILHDARRRRERAGARLGGFGSPHVCEIALRNLTPVARAEVSRLLDAHPAIRREPAQRPNMAGPAPIPIIPPPRARSAAAPSISSIMRARTLAVTGPGCGVAPRCVVSAIPADFAILHSADGARSGAGRGARLSRPLARRHPPAAAQLFSDDRRRQ